MTEPTAREALKEICARLNVARPDCDGEYSAYDAGIVDALEEIEDYIKHNLAGGNDDSQD